MIPKLFVQVCPSAFEPPAERIWQDILPHWQYHKFDEPGMVEYFRNHPLSGFSNIEEKFWSFEREGDRTNLFVLYYLFQNGGVYVDCKANVDKNLEALLTEDVVLVSSWLNHYNYRYIFTGFIMVEVGNELILAALENYYNTITRPWEQCHYWFNKEMYRITRSYRKQVKILQQHNSSTSSHVSQNYGVSFILDQNEMVLIIPDN